MLNSQDLDSFKLVDESNLAPDNEVRRYLDNAFTQGSQNWGVTKEVAIVLTLARDLKVALALAETATLTQNKMKGLQLEVGRLKKRLDKQTKAA